MKYWNFCRCWCLRIKHFHHVLCQSCWKRPENSNIYICICIPAVLWYWMLQCWSQNGCHQAVKVTTWFPVCRGSFSREHHAAAKICLHKSVRLSLHLCLCCSCQQWLVVCLTAPPRCCATWKGYFDRGGSAQKTFLISDFHPHCDVGTVCISHKDEGWYLKNSFWPMQQHPDVERTSPFGGGHYGFQATKA